MSPSRCSATRPEPRPSGAESSCPELVGWVSRDELARIQALLDAPDRGHAAISVFNAVFSRSGCVLYGQKAVEAW